MPALSSWLNTRTNANDSPLSAPVTFASPNLLELSALYNAARSEPYELTSHPHWWRTIDSFNLGSEFRFQLEHLARLPATSAPHPNSSISGGSGSDGKGENKGKKTLGFLVHDGVAQMAINLLPFFQNFIIKCGSIGVILVSRIPSNPVWMAEQTNIPHRTIVVHGKSDTILLRHFPAHIIAEDTIVNVTGAGDTLVGALLAEVVRDPGLFEGRSGGLEAIDVTLERAQGAAVKTLQSSLAVSPLLSVAGS